MRLLATALLLVATSWCLTAQNASRSFDLTDFSELRLTSAFDVTILQGDFAVEVSAKDRFIDDVEAYVRNGVLVLKLNNHRTMRDPELKATITMPSLEAVDASGATSVVSDVIWRSESFDVEASGAADVSLRIDAGSTSVSASGASDITLEGNTGTLKVQASGASDVVAKRLVAADVTCSSSGASDITVNATESITARASGGSDITYSGGAERVKVSSSGGADIHSSGR